VASEWRALRVGESARERRRQLERAHEHFTTDAQIADDPARLAHFAMLAGIRPLVVESWLRSQRHPIDLDRPPTSPVLDEAALEEERTKHPISRVLPIVQRLLIDDAADSGFIVAIGDASGRLLWLDGDYALRSAAEEMGFRAGMDWSEAAVGTSAPGSALALDHAIQVMGAEHYHRAVHPWSCTAAPVHDPVTGAIIGVIDVTGGDAVASPHILPLVEATLAAVEAELKLESLRSLIERERPRPSRHAKPTRSAVPDVAAPPRLIVLGREPALLERGGETVAVGGRHAEILVALADAPAGLSAAQLAEQVYGSADAEPTLRPELVRLRKWLAAQSTGLELHSRPYRLSTRPRLDASEALEALARGAHRLALAAYEGPVLPGSVAPVIEQLRAEVDATLRESMLQSAASDVLFTYAQNWAVDDAEVGSTLLQVLPQHSPKRGRAVARLEALAS